MSDDVVSGGTELRSFKRRLERAWIFSPERLWLLSIALDQRGRARLAFLVKQLNTILYHNSLSPEARVSADVALGHYSHGIVVNGGVRIGARVKIWHNVTLTGRAARSSGATAQGRAEIVVEDGVKIGTNAVVIAKRGELLTIGRNARIGAGAIVTHDIPAGATVVSPTARVIPREQADPDATEPSAEIGSATEHEP